MTKWCKCGHKKGEHAHFRVRNYDGIYCQCQHDNQNCRCIEFEEVSSKADSTQTEDTE